MILEFLLLRDNKNSKEYIYFINFYKTQFPQFKKIQQVRVLKKGLKLRKDKG